MWPVCSHCGDHGSVRRRLPGPTPLLGGSAPIGASWPCCSRRDDQPTSRGPAHDSSGPVATAPADRRRAALPPANPAGTVRRIRPSGLPAARQPTVPTAPRSSRSRPVRALDALPVGVVVLGPDGRVAVWNAAAHRLTGWPERRSDPGDDAAAALLELSARAPGCPSRRSAITSCAAAPPTPATTWPCWPCGRGEGSG